MTTSTRHPLAERASLTGGLPQGVKNTPQNVIRYGQGVLDLIGQFPPETRISNFDLSGLYIHEDDFDRLFAGCEVNESENHRWVYLDHIEVKCWNFSSTKEQPKRWTRRLPEVQEAGE